jgi:hypothetical protein
MITVSNKKRTLRKDWKKYNRKLVKRDILLPYKMEHKHNQSLGNSIYRRGA